MTRPTRPLLRWFGGKWRLAPWIISHFPEHRVYVEPFGGGGAVLLRKTRCYAEVWNDLDGEVVNLFGVLRSDDANRLIDQLRLTPFAEDEFMRAYERTDEPVERARRLIIRSFMGFGGNACQFQKTGFRAYSYRSGTTPAHDWKHYPAALAAIVERLEGVVIASKDAVAVMAQHDGPGTLHYVDPPYVHATRSRPEAHCYAHEMDDAAHAALLERLRGLTGFVVLSGYPSPAYDAALHDWHRVEREALADGAQKRTEVLWLNPRCAAALDARDVPLFGHSIPMEAAE
jgi:DNA adenine methylase